MRTGRTSPEKGFTLLEVLVAMTVFSLVVLAAYAVFNAAIRSERVGLREAEKMMRARYVFDSLERDLTNIVFRDETSYNVSITRLLEQMEEARLEAEETGDWEPFYAAYGDPAEDDDDEDPSVGNPYERGRLIDLQFLGEDQDHFDALSFSVVDAPRVGRRYRPYGITRVQYSIQDGVMVRSEDDIETEPRTIDGELLERPEPPEHAILAEGITEFDIRYAFWFDNQWYETDQWSSANRQVRNPRYYVGEHDFGFEDRPDNDFSLRPGDAGWNEYVNDLDSEPLDRLPAYLRIKLAVKDPGGTGRPSRFTRIIRLNPSLETWIPGTELDEDQRDDEREARDQYYSLILPGVSGID